MAIMSNVFSSMGNKFSSSSMMEQEPLVEQTPSVPPYSLGKLERIFKNVEFSGYKKDWMLSV